MQKMNKKVNNSINNNINNNINNSINYNSFKNQKKFGYYIPIIYIIVIIPLIVHGKIIELPLEIANFWKGGTTYVDFFNYYKFIALIIGTTSALISFGGLYLNDRIRLYDEKKYYIPMLVYSIFAILSTIISSNKQVAIEGFIEMNQGIFILLSYNILTFILMNYTNNERDIKIFLLSFAILTITEGFIGLSQYLGYDFFQTKIGQWLISPEYLMGKQLKFTFGSHTIYGTMYNTNFVGSFATLVLPISFIHYLYSKNKKDTILYFLASIFAFMIWIGCNSRAGYLGIIIVSILGLLIFRKVLKERYKRTLFIFVCYIIILLVFNKISGGRIITQLNRLFPNTESKTISDVQKQQIRFEDVLIEDNKFIIKTSSETLVGKIINGNLSFYDGTGNKLALKVEGNEIIINNEGFEDYKFNMSSSIIRAKIYGRDWDLCVTKDGQVKVISINDKLTTPIKAERIKFFDGKETFASNRGYIWSRTIPILKDTLLIGFGPDNYPMVFPQEDYVGRFNVGTNGMMNVIIDKPHNMYLQIAINTGVVSLGALLFMWIAYLIECLKIYTAGNITTFTEYMGAAIFLSITAYLTAGIFNDSVISVAPLFWVLLGMGIAINRMVNTGN